MGDDDGGGSLKIDEDRIDGSDLGPGKENLENKNMDSDRDQDSIAVGDLDNSNGVSEEEEEPSMPGPGGENYGGVDTASEIINPWTGGRTYIWETFRRRLKIPCLLICPSQPTQQPQQQPPEASRNLQRQVPAQFQD